MAEDAALPQRHRRGPLGRERNHVPPVARDGSEVEAAVGFGRAGGDRGQPREDREDREEAGATGEASDAAAAVAAEMERVNEWFEAQLAASSSQGGQVLLHVPFMCLYVALLSSETANLRGTIEGVCACVRTGREMVCMCAYVE